MNDSPSTTPDTPGTPAPLSPVAAALAGSAALRFALPPGRESVAELSARAQRAVIAPADPGGWPASWRCAVAARIATLHGDGDLAEAYGALIADPADAPLALPDTPGRDGREAAALGFLDAVSTCPRDVRAEDVTALEAAGVAGPDIVRLCELAAFLAYHCRVAWVLSRLQGGVA